MPNDVTIERARLVAACRSSLTPVESTPNSTRSPAAPATIAISWRCEVRLLQHHHVLVDEHVTRRCRACARGRRSRASAAADRLPDRARRRRRATPRGSRSPSARASRQHVRSSWPGRRRRGRSPPRASPGRSRCCPRGPPAARASLITLASSAPREARRHAARSPSVDASGVERPLAAVQLAGSRTARGRRACRSTTWRSKRPGRSSAGSRMSGRFVAPMTTMPASPPKPSISTSSWLSVCSRSSLPWPMPAPRLRPGGVELVDEDDRRRHLARLARTGRGRGPRRRRRATRRTPTPETREEGRVGLARDGPGEQRLAGARRADEQHALRRRARPARGTWLGSAR